MPWWYCPDCHKDTTYSSNYSRGDKTVKCAVCGRYIPNPFYIGEDEPKTVIKISHRKKKLNFKNPFKFWVVLAILIICSIVLFYTVVNSKTITQAEARSITQTAYEPYKVYRIWGDILTIKDLYEKEHAPGVTWLEFYNACADLNGNIARWQYGEKLYVPRELVK